MTQLSIPGLSGISGRTASRRQAHSQPYDRNENLHREIWGFVIQRERALESVPGAYDMPRRRAVSKMKVILNHISTKKPDVQRRYIASHKPEILLLLPSERSRFHKQRTKILQLINEL